MEQFQKEKEELDKGCRECKRKLAECQKKMKELELAEPESGKGELEKLQAEAQQLKNEEKSWENKLEELRKKEKNMPWNVDTLSKDGFSKSVFNVKPEEKEETEEQKEKKHKTFVERYEKQIKHFGMLRRWDDSQKYLSDNPHLVCEETANYLVIWCIDLEVEEKHALMEQVAHQTIVMQFILELAKSLKVDPRACFRQFFTKIKVKIPPGHPKIPPKAEQSPISTDSTSKFLLEFVQEVVAEGRGRVGVGLGFGVAIGASGSGNGGAGPPWRHNSAPIPPFLPPNPPLLSRTGGDRAG
ncbi:hsp90 co-chaperone Cdc37-like [Malurus melanocephalus]|nr:hsp90 co-chaperone Cdc37-like [Malurus melanocephalus]